jgi:hypothetical protein
LAGSTFNLPFCLHIPDGEYDIKLTDDSVVKLKFQTIIPKKYDERIGYRCLTRYDLTNNVSKVVIHNLESINKDGFRNIPINVNEIWNVQEFSRISHFIDNNGKAVSPGFEDNIPTGEMIYLNAEIDKDRLGRLRYTRVTILSDRDESKGSAITAINKLVDAYRIVSEEYWLNRINEHDILFTSTQSGGDFGFSYKGATKIRPSLDQEKVNLLRDLLSNNEPLPTFHLLLLDAKKALDEENYSLAVIYSITSLESVVKQFIDKFSKQQRLEGHSSRNLKRLSISNMVTVGLRLILNKEEFPDKMIEDFTTANGLRNDIIHESKMEVVKEAAVKAFNTVSKIESIILPKLNDIH